MEISRLDRGRNETELTLAGLDDVELCVGRFDFKVTSEGGIGDDELSVRLQLDEGTGNWTGMVVGRHGRPSRCPSSLWPTPSRVTTQSCIAVADDLDPRATTAELAAALDAAGCGGTRDQRLPRL